MAFSAQRARRLWAYWRAEQRTLRQGFVALLLSTVAAFAAGLTLGSITDTLEALPGLVILVPTTVGMRGVIFGAMGARLGTSTHAGLFAVTWEREGVLAQNAQVGVILTFVTSIMAAALARGAAAVFGLDSISLVGFLTISVVGAVLASGLIMVVTIGLAVLSYRRGYDLDAVATPLITAVGDMVTLPMLFAATFLLRVDWLNAALATVCVLGGAAVIVRGTLAATQGSRRILLETLPVILLAPILDILAGTVLDSRLERFVAFPGLLILVPPFISQAGALGGILSSRLTSKIQVGVITPRGLPEVPATVDASLVASFGIAVFTLIGAVAVLLSMLTGLATPGAPSTIGLTLLAGLLATGITITVAYYLAILTTRFGLNPDNHGVPIITSVMDLTGILCLLFAMSVFGVSANG